MLVPRGWGGGIGDMLFKGLNWELIDQQLLES